MTTSAATLLPLPDPLPGPPTLRVISQDRDSSPPSTATRPSRQESRRLKSLAKCGVQERAALLVAQDALSDALIAGQLAIDRRTLTRWRKLPEFQAQVERRRRVWRHEREARGVATLKAGFTSLDSRWQDLWEIVAERAASPEMQNVPGGRTGLLYGRRKSFRNAGKVCEVTNYYLDVKLLGEFRALEVQAAKQSGQWGLPLENPDGSNPAASCSHCCPLSGKREQAAQLAAEDELSDAEIAECCRIDRRTLSRWRWQSKFRGRIEEYRERRRQACDSYGISAKWRRLKALDDRVRGFNRIIVERGASPEMRKAPGGRTGLLRRLQKVLRVGSRRCIVVSEFPFDCALVREYREHLMQVAKELGQVQEERRANRPWAIRNARRAEREGPAIRIIMPDPTSASTSEASIRASSSRRVGLAPLGGVSRASANGQRPLESERKPP